MAVLWDLLDVFETDFEESLEIVEIYFLDDDFFGVEGTDFFEGDADGLFAVEGEDFDFFTISLEDFAGETFYFFNFFSISFSI